MCKLHPHFESSNGGGSNDGGSNGGESNGGGSNGDNSDEDDSDENNIKRSLRKRKIVNLAHDLIEDEGIRNEDNLTETEDSSSKKKFPSLSFKKSFIWV